MTFGTPGTKSYCDPPTLSQSSLVQDASIRKKDVFDENPKMTTSTFEANDSLPQPPILRSTALLDLGATSLSGDDPVNRSNVASCQNIFLSSSILDQTAYALRRAIVDSLIKNPKTFRGGKDDVKHIAKSLLGQTQYKSKDNQNFLNNSTNSPSSSRLFAFN
ncbi:unnamed protein product [Rotaria sordida]|uniref:Uncharacterized protein n=1 Tax=Rotaria sordida TaxID=392033 RepID=A0A818YR30_9BILA|nr:unnamed protein product [Rotaria sordida]